MLDFVVAEKAEPPLPERSPAATLALRLASLRSRILERTA